MTGFFFISFQQRRCIRFANLQTAYNQDDKILRKLQTNLVAVSQKNEEE
jgi:hypothetical protein